MRILLMIVLGLMAPVWASAAEPIASIPYRVDYNGWFAVKVSVNGQGPYDFIVDTGATRSIVFANLARTQPFAPSGGPDTRVLGTGSEEQFPTHVIGDITLGAARLDNLVTVILDDWRVGAASPHGILGLDFLTRYRVVFDQTQGQMRIYPAGSPPERGERRWQRVGLTPQDFGLNAGVLYTVEGRIERRRLTFLFDTGASSMLINGRAFAKMTSNAIGVSVRPSGGDARQRIQDSLNSSARGKAIRVGRFSIGDVSFYLTPFVVWDAPVFEDIGKALVPFGLFGASPLVDRSFSLDFETRQLAIEPRGRSPGKPMPTAPPPGTPNLPEGA